MVFDSDDLSEQANDTTSTISDEWQIPSDLNFTIERASDIDVVRDNLPGPNDSSEETSDRTLEGQANINTRYGSQHKGARSAHTSAFVNSTNPVGNAEESQMSTQTRSDNQMRDRLRELMNPQNQMESLPATQQVASESTRLADYQWNVPSIRLRYSSSKLAGLRSRRGYSVRQQRPKSSKDISTGAEPLVRCQCGFSNEGEEMLCCDICDSWQHAHCYGYVNLTDPRMPNEHVCYVCLLGKDEAQVLDELRNMALLRRAIHLLVEKNGMRTVKSFAEDLQCDLQTASNVVRHLKSQNYLVRTSESHTRGFAQTGKPSMKLATYGSQYQTLMKQFFDPSSNIAHHLADVPLECSQRRDCLKVDKGTVYHDCSVPLNIRRPTEIREGEARKTRSTEGKRYNTRSSQINKLRSRSPTLVANSAGLADRHTLSPASNTTLKRTATAPLARGNKKLKMSKACGELDVSYRSPTAGPSPPSWK